MEQDGVVGFSQFCAIFSPQFGVYAIHLFLVKMPHKTDVPHMPHVDAVSAVASSRCSFLCVAVPAVWIPPAVCPVLNRPIGGGCVGCVCTPK